MHLHHYVEGVCSGQHAVPAACGEVQKFRAPQGQPTPLPDVTMDLADLAALLVLVEIYPIRVSVLPIEVEDLLVRVRALL